MKICPAGTFSAANSSTCTSAPGGFYTLQGITDTAASSTQCDRGFYCPPGAYGPTDETCGVNYYTVASIVAYAFEKCTICPGGFYCLKGVTDPIACPVGFYCLEAELYPIPCEKGSFRATIGAALLSDCTTCTAGQICSHTTLTAPDKDCDAGFYCPAGTVFSRTTESCTADPCEVTTSTNIIPSGKTRAVKCPAGSYCPPQSATHTPCPAGTYNTVPGQRELASCLACPAGKHCTGTGNTEPDGKCSAGYYCVAGSDSITKTASDAGHFSIAGAAIQTKCSPGTYQTAIGQSSCTICELGHHCPGFGNSVNTDCPAGFYCPLGSDRPTPCPAGTYRATTLGEKVAHCTACDAGSYCEKQGLIAVTGTCNVGFYCSSGAISNQPTLDTSTAVEADQRFGPCWTGHFCEAMTTAPTPCLAGTYNDALMGKSVADCKVCLPGTYCAGTGNKAPDGNCDVGHFCLGGNIINTPATQCAVGEYCPSGSSMATKCPAGSYQPTAVMGVCIACTAGKYCPLGTSIPIDCPAGYYCLENTKRSNQYPCEKGKFNTALGATVETQCLTCTAGNVCEFEGTADETVTTCTAGYFCLEGSTFSIPESSTFGRMCASGEFCPAASTTATACTGGSYCETYLLSAVTGLCSAGYFCGGGSRFQVIPADFANAIAAICPIGKYCVTGTTTPADCPVGTYSDSTGLGLQRDCYT